MRRRWRRFLCRVLGHAYGPVTLSSSGAVPDWYVPIEQCPRCGEVWYP